MSDKTENPINDKSQDMILTIIVIGANKPCHRPEKKPYGSAYTSGSK